MAQPLREFAAFPEDLNLMSGTHIMQLTIVYNSSFRGLDTSGLLGHLHSCGDTTYIYT